MTDVKLCPPSKELIAYLAENLVDSDKQELASMHPNVPLESVIHDSVSTSFFAMVATLNGLPAAIFGCAVGDDTNGAIGVPWAMFTPLARKYPKTLIEVAKTYISQFEEWFPVLTNAVDVRNFRTVKWLRRLGFTFGDIFESPAGDPFIAFTRFKDNV